MDTLASHEGIKLVVILATKCAQILNTCISEQRMICWDGQLSIASLSIQSTIYRGMSERKTFRRGVYVGTASLQTSRAPVRC
jgi:hypothetical protein